MGHRVDRPRIIWSHSEALHKRVQQLAGRRSYSYRAKWQLKNNGMLNSQWLSFISSLMFLNLFSSDRRVTATLYALRIQHRRVRLLKTERAAYYCCSTANCLQIELTQSHTQPGQPGYNNDSNRLQWRRKSHLHRYFLSLVIEASLQETKRIQSFQIAEDTKKSLQHTGQKGLLNTYWIYLTCWKADTSFVNMFNWAITTTAKMRMTSSDPKEEATWLLHEHQLLWGIMLITAFTLLLCGNMGLYFHWSNVGTDAGNDILDKEFRNDCWFGDVWFSVRKLWGSLMTVSWQSPS